MNHICFYIALCLLAAGPAAQCQWVQTNGPPGGAVRALTGSGSYLFAALDSGGVWRTTDGGANWTPANSGLPNGRIMSSLAVCGTGLFAGTYGAGVFRSTDFGTGWTPSGLADTSVYALEVSGASMYAATGTGVYRTIDSGVTWSPVDSGLTDRQIRFLAASGERLLASTAIGRLFLSTNNGESWTQNSLSSSAVDSPFPVGCLGSVLFAAGSTWIMGTWTGWLARSTDDGTTWTFVLFDRVEWLHVDGNHLYAGTNGYPYMGPSSVFLSTDGGTLWTDIGAGLPGTLPKPLVCPASALHVAGAQVFAGTPGNGVWRRSLSEIVSVSTTLEGIPSSFGLEQNYPNPFNGISNFEIRISKCGWVNLAVFDVLGRGVSVLMNGPKDPGRYEVRWDASGLPSGVYFYRMTAGRYTSTRMMVLSK